MNKIITTFLYSLFGINILAQTYYYDKTKTFTEDGYTYQCDIRESGMITLYKKGDKWIYAPQIVKSTGEIFQYEDDVPDIIETVDNNFIYTCKSIINNAFSYEEKKRVKEDFFIFSMYVNTDSGKIEEVAFEFHQTNPCATIPVSVYRKMEVEMKQKLSFKVTEEGKKLNYILYWTRVAPE